MRRQIFRQVALDRQSSPDQLDHLLHIASPASTLMREAIAGLFTSGWLRRRLTRTGERFQRVRVPTVLQMEAVECGAATLAMVLGYYGRIVPLEEVRVACGVSRDGSKASSIITAARNYGLKAKGFKKEPADLPKLALPLIVFWNFNHFVVVEGFGPDRVYLNDPSIGRRRVSAEEFDQSFTGVVLVFNPDSGFQKGGRQLSMLAALRERLVGARLALLGAILATLALLIPGLIIPRLAQTFVDQVLVSPTRGLVRPLLIGLACTAALQAVLTWLQSSLILQLGTRLSLKASRQFFWHVLRLPVEFFAQRYAGEIGARVAINDRVASMLSGELAAAVLSLVLVIFYAVLMFQYDVVLTLIGIGVALLNIVVLLVAARRRVESNRQLLQDRGKLLGTSYAGLEMVETLKATSGETDFFARWAGHHARVVNAEQQLAVFSQLVWVIPSLLFALNTAVILVIGGLRIVEGQMTIGMLVAFQSLMASFLSPINQIVALGGRLQELSGDMHRLDDILRYPVDPHVQGEIVTGVPVAKLAGLVELRDITFGYNRMAPPLIEGLNLTLKPGDRVALVGGSGSGKSTVAKLVAGLYQPWSGTICFDGQPRQELPRSVLTHSLTFVDQDIALFAGTVRDNLSLWDTDISNEAIVTAGRDAAIHDEIMARPGGYDARIDEDGRNLSGGQRQRLEIARALALEPTMLVLDEATSALDPITEQIIDANLRRRGCTCLIVAHRLSTIRDADEIIVLDGGKIIQRGTHDDLVRIDGPYVRLIAAEEPLGMAEPLLLNDKT